MLVTINVNRLNRVTSVKNNKDLPGYNKVKVSVGDHLPADLLALFLMNPHRFKIVRDSN